MSISFGVQDVRSFEAIASRAVPPVYLSSRGNYFANYGEALDDERVEERTRAPPAVSYQPQPVAYPPIAYPPIAYPPALPLDFKP